MIAEGLLTTIDATGTLNVAPMGPIVHGDFAGLTLRPFRGSTTYDNLLATGTAVFHIVDHVGVIAEAAIRKLRELPDSEPARKVSGRVLVNCCRWFELRVIETDTTDQRAVMPCEVIHTENRRPFWGFNRARHAILEAAILSTRLHLLKSEDVQWQLVTLRSAVEKTGGDEEFKAFEMLSQYVANYYAGVTVE